jgi:segregation and condensation protein B
MSTKAKIEAVIYAADEPVTLAQLAAIFGEELLAATAEPELPLPAPEPQPEVVPPETADAGAPAEASGDAASQPELAIEDPEARRRARLRERAAREAVARVVQELAAEYTNSERGVEIREIAGGYRVATKPEYHDAVRAFIRGLKPPMKLSLQALETLAVIAYKQPITAPEISEIRGVDTAGVLGGLMARKLITTAGRKQVIGRPILYKTTREFLLRFGLKDVSELPSIEEFEKMAAGIGDDVPEEAVEPSPEDAATPSEESAGQPAAVEAHNEPEAPAASQQDQ